MRGLRYVQSTGELRLVNGEFWAPLCVGYAGAPGFVNDPDAQCRKSLGPLPRGTYLLREVSHWRFAAPSIRLDPHPETKPDLCGRSGFYIHGDNRKADRSASSGCIVLDRGSRQCISALIKIGYETLEVVP